jgi:carbon-monoxide dehydrogenase medium subunit
MRFFQPDTIDDAVGLLGEGAGYRCLAGGGVVVPALRGGDRPAGLISLKRVAALRGVARRGDGVVRVGAMTAHDAVSSADQLTGGNALVRRAAGQIAHPVIRNMATIGGTLCAGIPAADYGCALLAAGAVVHLCSRGGARPVTIDGFLLADGASGGRDPARREDELVTAITLPDGSGGSGDYVRFSRVDGDYPVVSVGIRLQWVAGAVESARIAVGGCGPAAYRVPGAEAALVGLTAAADVPAGVFDAYVAAARPVGDLKGSADYRLMLIPGLLRRALDGAFADRPAAS